MKTFITILFLFLCLNSQAQTHTDYQNYSKKDAIISASILGATFITNEAFAHQMNGQQAMAVNFSGIGLSVGYSLFVTTKPYKKIQHRLKMKRNKSISKPELICVRYGN